MAPAGGGWRVTTNRGPLWASNVIAATNAYTGRLLPHLRFPVACLYGVQSATVPLEGLAHILPQRQGFSDVRKRFFRLDEARPLPTSCRTSTSREPGCSLRWASPDAGL